MDLTRYREMSVQSEGPELTYRPLTVTLVDLHLVTNVHVSCSVCRCSFSESHYTKSEAIVFAFHRKSQHPYTFFMQL